MGIAIEGILNCHSVSRLIDFPRMYEEKQGLIWEEIFQFPNSRCESVVWRRYAPMDDDVHHIGIEREGLITKSRRPEMRYVGFVSAAVGPIRLVQTPGNHGFCVTHAPEEGQHHAHICYAPADGNLQSLKRAEKQDLKLRLRSLFGELVRRA